MSTPAASRRSNIGSPHISQKLLRGCGSSVNSMFTAQPLLRQYCTCREICSSVRSGRNEKQPWVMRMICSLHRDAGGGGVVGHVGRLVVEGDVLPDIERGLERRTGRPRLWENFRPFMQIVAAFIAGEDHRLQRDAVGGGSRLDAHRVSDGATAELQHHI